MTSTTLRKPERTLRRIAFGHRLGRWDIRFSPYLYVSPFFILFAVVGMFPLLSREWWPGPEWTGYGGPGP